MRLLAVLNPWSGVREARAQLQESQSARKGMRALAGHLEQIERENSIAAKVHRAARGARDS